MADKLMPGETAVMKLHRHWIVLIKSLIIRYGGVKLYRASLPFFLGLILGDCLMGFASGLVGWIAGWHGSFRYG